MKRAKLLQQMIDTGVICVIRADSDPQALRIADAVIAGGSTGIELT